MVRAKKLLIEISRTIEKAPNVFGFQSFVKFFTADPLIKMIDLVTKRDALTADDLESTGVIRVFKDTGADLTPDRLAAVLFQQIAAHAKSIRAYCATLEDVELRNLLYRSDGDQRF